MKRMFLVCLLMVGGCIPAQVKELSTIEKKTIEVYTASCSEALDNTLLIYAAKHKAGKMADEEYKEAVASVEAVRGQGLALNRMHGALDEWLQVQGPAEAVGGAVKEIVPLIPDIMELVK